MNAFGTYQGSVLIGTLVRISRPISPIGDESRANTSDDCGSGMICQASPVRCAVSCAPAVAANAAIPATASATASGRLRDARINMDFVTGCGCTEFRTPLCVNLA